MKKDFCEKHFEIQPLFDANQRRNLKFGSKFNESFVNDFEPYAIEILRTMKWTKEASQKFGDAGINFESVCGLARKKRSSIDFGDLLGNVLNEVKKKPGPEIQNYLEKGLDFIEKSINNQEHAADIFKNNPEFLDAVLRLAKDQNLINLIKNNLNEISSNVQLLQKFLENKKLMNLLKDNLSLLSEMSEDERSLDFVLNILENQDLVKFLENQPQLLQFISKNVKQISELLIGNPDTLNLIETFLQNKKPLEKCFEDFLQHVMAKKKLSIPHLRE